MSADTGTGCHDHAGLPAEVRAILLGALDRIAPALERMQAEPGRDGDEPTPPGAPCAVCPVCALIAAWRGEHSELTARAAEHLAGLVAVLRAALDEGVGAPAAADESARGQPPPSGPPVQRISVRR